MRTARADPARTRDRAPGSPAAQPRIVRGDALKASPWKNGGGVTREIAAYPVGSNLETFVWRVSVADVEQPGAFSRFPGVDRTLVLLDGKGMRLVDKGRSDGLVHALTKPLDVARFDGAATIDAELLGGATRDFNLMVRRNGASAALAVWTGASVCRHRLDADAALVFCAAGSIELRFSGAPHPPTTLAAMDTLVLDAPRGLVCDVVGEGAALAVLICYA